MNNPLTAPKTHDTQRRGLEGKSALVTGSARGIGFAVADRLAQEGACVLLCDIDGEGAKTSAARIAQIRGVRSEGEGGDVSKPEDCERIIRTALDKFTQIDILVNNAGIKKDNLAVRMSEADWDAVLDVNLKGAFLMSKAAMRPMMKQRRGRIINISSVVGQMGNAGQANYSASKSALLGLTKSLARELAGRNILVNAVAPGFVKTSMTDGLKDEAKTALLEMIPLGRFAEPDDIARAVLFLAGDDSAYITGQVLAVNGGLYM
ncbi:MAG: 3-oxoacyl-[acyl-carrier-protein] reductase [bacterium]